MSKEIIRLGRVGLEPQFSFDYLSIAMGHLYDWSVWIGSRK